MSHSDDIVEDYGMHSLFIRAARLLLQKEQNY
jgi:hypothetical protein